MRFFAAVQDNREPGGNPGRSRRCIRGAFFQPEGGHGGNGKTRKSEDAQVRRPAEMKSISLVI